MFAKKAKNNKRKEVIPDPDFDARTNLIGFFSLLLEVDKRVNPQKYALSNENKKHA